ncbi:MAG: DUF2817 domain-containing protein [Gemmatimonadota bacterium]|jgi:hypothetical protein
MRVLLPVVLLFTACAVPQTTPHFPAPSSAPSSAASSATPSAEALAPLQRRYRVAGLDRRDFNHEALWSAIGPIVDSAADLARREVGRSALGRPLYAVSFGHGPTRVLLWSQMHGNESTATMALADVLRFLAEAPDDPLARRLADGLTVLFVPMLNPDGAERFQRRNAQGIDINRDARSLATPEARALKGLQASFHPDFGFNLHDQNVRTRVGRSSRLAAISLLAPAYDSANSVNETRTRALHVAAVVLDAVRPFVEGHVTRYDDTFNPRAFGDLMQHWGVSTVLIESGGWHNDPEKQYLRRVNFVALLTALDAIATGRYVNADPATYRALPYNGRAVEDLLVHGGTIVAPGLPSYAADLAIQYSRPLRRQGGRITDVGDLSQVEARDTLDVSGLYVHLRRAPDAEVDAGPHVAPGETPANFDVRRGPEPDSPLVWRILDGAPQRVPADGSGF